MEIHNGAITLETIQLPNKSLSALLQPRNGILPHVRELRVSCDDSQIGESCSQDAETFVQLVVAALPRNCLKSFNSFLAVSSRFVLHLLQCHRKLESLFIIVGDSPHGTSLLKLDTASNALWLSPCLQNIERLATFITPGRMEQFYDSRFLIRNAPQLKELIVATHGKQLAQVHLSPDGTDDLFNAESQESTSSERRVLDLLGLCGLDFSARTSSLLSFINASALQSLQLSQCKNIGPLLIALAAEFKHSCSLVEFDITLIDAPTLELSRPLTEPWMSWAPICGVSGFSPRQEATLTLIMSLDMDPPCDN